MFVIDIPVRQVHELTGRAETTITSWLEVCRTVCSAMLADRQKMVGTDVQPIQIDEARFAGRRKCNRGRVLAGDVRPTSTNEDVEVRNLRNHGPRVVGPWVFGLRQDADCCYFIVERRDEATLITII